MSNLHANYEHQLRGISNETAYITVETAGNIKLDLPAREAVCCNATKVEVTLSRALHCEDFHRAGGILPL